MSTVAFEVSDDALVALKLDAAGAASELRLAAAVKLYELGRLSSGAAAGLAGLPRVAFLAKLAQFGAAALSQSEAEIAEDAASA